MSGGPATALRGLSGDGDARVLLTGSHIGTVVHGGAYDGALGVLSAIVAVEACAATGGAPRRTVEVVSLCEEESSRFHCNYFGTPPHPLDAGPRTVLQQAADAGGASWRDLPSGAGHDSQTMGTRVAAAVLFVPSIDGRSPSPAEYSTPED